VERAFGDGLCKVGRQVGIIPTAGSIVGGLGFLRWRRGRRGLGYEDMGLLIKETMERRCRRWIKIRDRDKENVPLLVRLIRRHHPVGAWPAGANKHDFVNPRPARFDGSLTSTATKRDYVYSSTRYHPCTQHFRYSVTNKNDALSPLTIQRCAVSMKSERRHAIRCHALSQKKDG